MAKPLSTRFQQNVKLNIPVTGLIQTLKNIKEKIDAAAGSATFLELHLRIIAQNDPRVQTELTKAQAKNSSKKCSFHQADLNDLIEATICVYQNNLDSTEQDKLKKIRVPRNKTIHGSFAELMIELNGAAPGREIDPLSRKRKLLAKDDIIEGVLSIERNGGLEEFAIRANEAVEILQRKILYSST